MPGLWLLIAYLIVVSVYAVLVTIYDKRIAVKNGAGVKQRRRVPERDLLLIAAIGGSVAMYITMKKIRHKTQHKKFMVGIPCIMAAQAVLAALIIWFGR